MAAHFQAADIPNLTMADRMEVYFGPGGLVSEFDKVLRDLEPVLRRGRNVAWKVPTVLKNSLRK